jgi:hypothetical protein
MHKIDVITLFGAKESWYFSTKSKLLTRMEEPLNMPEGPSTAITIFTDYREVNGVKLSFTQIINMPGQTRKISFAEIAANLEIDKNLFSPAE